MTILTQASDAITREMVLEFLQDQIPESINLEYKSKYTPKVLESIAAMANTNGGVILLGVGEKNGLPLQDPAGVPLSDVSTIINRCWTVLDPPFAPEIISVQIEEEGYVLLIRVDSERVDRPVLLDGRVKIRLHGRNAIAGRREVAALFAEQAVDPRGRSFRGAGNYGSRNAHPLLSPEDEGLGIRLVLSGRVTSAGPPVFGTSVHRGLEEALYDAPLEQWLRRETDRHFHRPSTVETWSRAGLNTSTIVTFAREPVETLDRNYLLKGQCVLEGPHGPTHGDGVALLLGLAFEPSAPMYQALSLMQLYELTHVLYATALDVIAPRLFPAIVGSGLWEPVGPNLHLDPGNANTLDRYVDFANLPQAPDSPDVRTGSLVPAYGDDLRNPSRRDEIIKDWLIRMLLDGGYTRVEEEVNALSPRGLTSGD
jgi:hypothetical protein